MAAKPIATRPAAESYKPKPSAPTTKPAPTTSTKFVPLKTSTVSSVNKQIAAGLGSVSQNITDVLGLVQQYLGGGTGVDSGSGPIVNPGNRTDASYVAEGRSGTSNTGKKYIEGRLVSESEFNDWLGGGSSGGSTLTETPTTPEKTLALDTFKATLGLIFGKEEANKSYVSKLYALTSGFYKTGSTVEEAMNLALYQAENEGAIPEFTSRFAGIFALRDAKKNGAAVTVPTIAEFFATEAKMGEVLTSAGLGELATESFLGGIIGKNKSVNEVATLISDVFNTIDYAPKELKQTLSTYFPGVDRVSIAKAILTGPEGAQALSQKIKGVSVISAAQQYGMNINLETATDIANRGYDYNTALAGYGQVSSLGRANTLAEFTGGKFTQEQAQSAVFMKNANDLSQLSTLRDVEEARFQGSSGASKGAFSTQYLNKGSSAGQF
jgi:hypothetical protein